MSGKRKFWLVAFCLVQAAYVVLNIGYFRYYNTYLSVRQAFRLLGEFRGLAAGGGMPMEASLFLYLLDAPFVVMLLLMPFPVLARRPGGGTSDAEFTVLTSLQPLDDYAAFNLPDYQYPNSLPRNFSEAGYRVEAFHGNIGRYWNRQSVFKAMGFEQYWSKDTMGLPESGWGVKDDDLFSFLADRIESSDSPYFYLALTMSSHGPYRNVPLYYKDSRFDDVQAGMERNYLLSMSYVDSALGRFFYRMGNQLDDTIVVINGDHPEYYVQDEGPSFSRSAVRDGVRRLEFVPCIIIGPGLEPVSAARAATLADLAPTVSAASGIPYLLRSIGTDLLAEAASLPSVPFTGHEYSREELYRFAESTRSTKNPEGR